MASFLRPVFEPEGLHAHVGDLQVRFQRAFEPIELVDESEDFVRFFGRDFEVDRILVVRGFLVDRLAGSSATPPKHRQERCRGSFCIQDFGIRVGGEQAGSGEEMEQPLSSARSHAQGSGRAGRMADGHSDRVGGIFRQLPIER